MKKLRFLVLILLFSLILSLCAPMALALDDPEVGCYAAVLMDTATGTIFYLKNENDLVYPASLTKIMTVLLAVEAIEAGEVSLTDEVTALPGYNFDIIDDGSSASILEGETMTLEDLLYCAMLASANEACNIIAEYIGGSISQFVAMMNERAKELGCTNTNFVNTHGLPDDNHYTTAWDMSLIAREAVAHTLFMTLCNTAEYTIPATNVSAERELSSTNALINPNCEIYTGDYYYENASGVKTGHTTAAGYCLISTAARDGINLLSVVMNATATQKEDGSWDYGQFSDTITLFDWGFDNFSFREIIKSTDIITQVPVIMAADTDTVAVRPSNSISALLPNDEDLSTFVTTITIYNQEEGTDLCAPVSAGQVLGEITISRDGNVYGSSTLIASTAVALSRTEYMKTQIREALRTPVVLWTFWILLILFVGYLALVVRYRIKRHLYRKRLRDAKRAYVEEEETAQEEEVRKWFQESSQLNAGAMKVPDTDITSQTKITTREPAVRPTTGKTDSSEDQNFRDYFEEFFGQKK